MEEPKFYAQSLVVRALQMLDSGEYTVREVSDELKVPALRIHSWRGAVKRGAGLEIKYKFTKDHSKQWKDIAEEVISKRKVKK